MPGNDPSLHLRPPRRSPSPTGRDKRCYAPLPDATTTPLSQCGAETSPLGGSQKDPAVPFDPSFLPRGQGLIYRSFLHFRAQGAACLRPGAAEWAGMGSRVWGWGLGVKD